METSYQFVLRISVGLLFAACSTSDDCTQVQQPAVIASVIDAVTRQSIANGAVGFIETGSFTAAFSPYEKVGGTALRLAAYGGPGEYTVAIEHAGYTSWESKVTVQGEPSCGTVVPALVAAELTPMVPPG